MIKNWIISSAKKYIISKLNDLLEKNKDNVSVICSQIQTWTDKLNTISGLLTKIAVRCNDGKLEDQEVEDSISDIETIVKNWK